MATAFLWNDFNRYNKNDCKIQICTNVKCTTYYGKSCSKIPQCLLPYKFDGHFQVQKEQSHNTIWTNSLQ